MQLTGITLGLRKKDFQTKVNQAIADNVQFDAIKDLPEQTDVDKLFKIELASKYRNVDYLLEVLKSGDTLYISKVLKCTWIYEDQYSDRINPDFLHLNIFPHMSTKMKRKFLTIISTYVKNENRCRDWYEYCTNIDLPVYAYKYLIYTSPQYKKDVFVNKFEDLKLEQGGPMDLKHFIGKDVSLAEYYLEKLTEQYQLYSTLRQLSYIYTIDNNLYLNWLEKYAVCKPNQNTYRYRTNENFILGTNKTNSVLKHHKDRVLRNIELYIQILHKDVLVKNASTEEAKLYITALLPESVDLFWNMNFMLQEESLLNLIPSKERFDFIKKIFVERYPNEEFELSRNFYRLKCYKYMTAEQRESWAFRQIENPDKTILGNGTEDMDYQWYEFINFDKALVEIKKYIHITPDHYRRAQMVKVLIKAAKNYRDLTRLFAYYYERHVNESQSTTEDFIREVLLHHNISEADESCFQAFDKLMCSIDAYNLENSTFYRMNSLLPPVLIYYILQNLDMPEAVVKYLWEARHVYHLRDFTDKLNNENKETVYHYLLKTRLDKIKSYDNKPYNKETQKELRDLTDFIKHLNVIFGKPREIDYIDVAHKYMLLDAEYYYPNYEYINQELMIKQLKRNFKLVFEKLKKYFDQNSQVKLNTFLNLIKIYFADDLKQEILQFYDKLLSETQNRYALFAAVFGIFKLADENFKIDFMTRYSPANGKIDHVKIDKNQLYIQEAICRFSSYSRTPVPLSNILLYIKGDYAKYCLPMFNRYLMKMPRSECIKLINALLKSPVSIQKHGLRLAFKCFNAEDLKILIDRVWKKTKNISVRMVIYQSLFQLVVSKEENQEEFFEILLGLTLTIHQDDHPGIFGFITTSECIRDLPKKLRCRYLESFWHVVNNFPKNIKNLSRLVTVVSNIESGLEAMDKDFVKKMLEDFFKEQLTSKCLASRTKDPTEIQVNDIKFNLAITFILRSDYDSYLKSGLDLVELVIGKCFEMWNETSNKDKHYVTYYSHEYLYDFINGILRGTFYADNRVRNASNRIYYFILEKLQNTLPSCEFYINMWKLRTAIIANDVLEEMYLKDMPLSDTDFFIIVTKYVNEVVDLIKEVIDRKEFHISLLQEIGTEVNNSIQNLNLESKLKMENVKPSDVTVFLSKKLVESGITECIVLAITILPCDFSDYSRNEHGSLLKTMNSMKNYEIQALLYQNFIKSQFRKVEEHTSMNDQPR